MRDFTIAKKGDWGTVATFVAQQLLNYLAEPSDDALVEDGKFGDKTYAAVRRFQRRHPPLNDDGVVGPKTFAALGLKALVTHPVRVRAQRKSAHCWSAAASMLLGGIEPSAGQAKTERRGSLVAEDDNVVLFGQGLGWDFLPPQAHGEDLLPALRRAPLWMGGDSFQTAGTAGAIHALVLGGIYYYELGEMTVSVLKVYDPWPIGQGRIYFMDPVRPQLPGGSRFGVRWFLSPKTWTP
jgi:hypothetical protein